MHDAFEAFGASGQDAADNKALLAKGGKITMPVFASAPRNLSARTWPIICGSPPATSRGAIVPTRALDMEENPQATISWLRFPRQELNHKERKTTI